MGVLVVAEKDIAAQRIAEHLAEGRVRESKVAGTSTYELRWDGDDVTVVGLRGHILRVDYPRSLNSWRSVRERDLVWADPEARVAKHAQGIAEALRVLARESERVVVATDHDREGELIGTEALRIVQGANPGISVHRARFSALTADEVRRAFDDLGQVDEDLAASGEARQLVDLAWGAVLTRFVSKASGQTGKDFLSVGRVQSPTLALIVDRELEIQAFDPTPFWEVHADLEAADHGFEAVHSGGDGDDRFWDEGEARARHEAASRATTGRVTDVDRTRRRDRPPPPFNTTSFLGAATSLGLTAKRAMSLAEDLYTRGYVSYPRTDNTVYPPSLDLREVLERFTRGPFGDDAKRVREWTDWSPTRGKAQSTDHPPLHPVELAPKGKLSRGHWRVYELIVRRFLATLSPPAVTESLRVDLDLAGEPFHARGFTILEPGYRAVYPYVRSKVTELPPLAVGDEASVRDVRLDGKETEPPKRRGQGKLIERMEALGIGTKSTRADTIQKLYDRGYVEDDPPRPTEVGVALVEALRAHVPRVAGPAMTADLEGAMSRIAGGEEDRDGVVRRSRSVLAEVVEDLAANRREVGQRIREAKLDEATLGACPDCGEGLVVRKSKRGKRFVGCRGYPGCERTYGLPPKRYGALHPTGRACGTCGTPVVKLVRSSRKPWVLCLTMDCDGPDAG